MLPGTKMSRIGVWTQQTHTAWIAIDDADVENGCMQAIPKSHKDGIAMHAKSDKEGNLLSINQSIPDEYVDTSQATDMALRPDRSLSTMDSCITRAIPTRQIGAAAA